MIKLILAALAFASFATAPAHATDSEVLKSVIEGAGTCENFVRFDEQNVYLGFGAYKNAYEEPRSPIPASIRIIPIAHPDQAFTLQTDDAAIDEVVDGQTLFILTYSGIEQWNLTTRTREIIHNTYAFPGQMAYRQHARGFARYKDMMIIAHGRLGVSFFDLKNHRLQNQMRILPSQLPMESQAMDVSVQGHYAYVAVDSFTLPSPGHVAFSGIVVIDMDTQQVVREMNGMDPGVDAIVGDGSKMIVSFLGNPLWKYSQSSLQTRANNLPDPEARVWRFPIQGHPHGKAALDSKYYYTCYMTHAPDGETYIVRPLAIDRAAINMN